MSQRIQVGWGTFGNRRYLLPQSFQTIEEQLQDVTGAQVTISTTAGALLGLLRGDPGKSIIRSIKFTNGKNGCDSATITLNALPEIPFSYGSIVSINLFGRAEPWYCGVLEFSAEEIYGNESKGFVFKAKGFRDSLKKLRAATIVPALSDTADAVRYITQNVITAHTPILYRSSKIVTAAGVALQAPINLAKQNIDKTLDDLALMSSARWWVDGAGELNFQLIDTDTQRVFVTGYDANDVEVSINLESVFNRIAVRRSANDGDTMTGWTEAYQANDLTSQAQYGIREKVFEVPDYPDAACVLIGDTLLSDLSQPAPYASIGRIKIESVDDFLEHGSYSIIAAPSTYTDTACDCESAADWTLSGTGDMTLTDETSIITTEGVAAIKGTWTTNTNRQAVFTLSAPLTGDMLKLRFFARSPATGLVFQIGVGESSAFEHTFDCYISTADTYEPQVFDLSAFTGDLNKIGIKPLASAGSFYVDLIKVELTGHRHFDVELNKVEHVIEGNGVYMKAEFGELPSHVEGFAATLIQQAHAARSAMRVD